MSHNQLHKPPHPEKDVPEEFEPGGQPVAPDEGPVPAFIPDDPEHEREIDPGASQSTFVQRQPRQVVLA